MRATVSGGICEAIQVILVRQCHCNLVGDDLLGRIAASPGSWHTVHATADTTAGAATRQFDAVDHAAIRTDYA